jgi:multiple sugar transport system ATP-binding protein
MATIELTEISKTFRNRRRKGSRDAFTFEGSGDEKGEGSKTSPEKRSRKIDFEMKNLNLIIPDKKTVVLLGPSGCGKTTLLRIIAGLTKPDSGSVRYDGVDMQGTSPGERHIGIVFQQFALYPPLTAKQNILSYFFFKKKTPELNKIAQEKFEQTSKLLGVEIEYLLDRKPDSLSQGEKQRVALGRCITRDPRVILLDEPISNLDQQLRLRYRVELKKLLQRYGVTAVYVTHDQQEAMMMADLVAIMNIGSVEQVATYDRIYRNPANVFVANFLNIDMDTPAINFIDGSLISPPFDNYLVGIRPEALLPVDAGIPEYTLKATVSDILEMPVKGVNIVSLRVGEDQIVARIPDTRILRIGSELQMVPTEIHLFSRNTKKRVRSIQPKLR